MTQAYEQNGRTVVRNDQPVGRVPAGEENPKRDRTITTSNEKRTEGIGGADWSDQEWDYRRRAGEKGHHKKIRRGKTPREPMRKKTDMKHPPTLRIETMPYGNALTGAPEMQGGKGIGIKYKN